MGIVTSNFKQENNKNNGRKTNVILEEYKSLSEAIEFNKLSKSYILAVCNGKQKQAGGYFWKYK